MDTNETERIETLLEERPHKYSPDYYYTSSEFGSRWEDAGSAELANAIVGYDPLFVTFIDESQSRTFPIKRWEIDFGDGYFYGLTSGERMALSSYLSTGSTETLDSIGISGKRYYRSSRKDGKDNRHLYCWKADDDSKVYTFGMAIDIGTTATRSETPIVDKCVISAFYAKEAQPEEGDDAEETIYVIKIAEDDQDREYARLGSDDDVDLSEHLYCWETERGVMRYTLSETPEAGDKAIDGADETENYPIDETVSKYDRYMSASPYYDKAGRSFGPLSATFEIPGDIDILTYPGMEAKKYTETRHVEQFKVTGIMSPKDYKFVEDGNPENVRYPMANKLCKPEVAGRPGYVHVTSMTIDAKKTDVGENFYGVADDVEVDALDWGSAGTFQYNEIFKRPAVGASIYFDDLRGDDCTHVGMRFSNRPNERPIIGHMYKGPGVYTATFRIKPISSADYYGQLISASNFVEPGIEYLTKTIVVRPTCPCIRTKVYDTYLTSGGEVVKDDNGHKVYKRRNGKLMHAALSSDEYSADNPEFYGENESYIDFNPEIFRLYNFNKEKIFEGVSGYAPFVMASVKGLVRPNSFPISAVGLDHGDWFVDRVGDDEEAEVSAYTYGWPFWIPSAVYGKNANWDEKKRAFYMTNTHTFVMPGLYRANAVVRYDMERIPDFWHSELSACDSKGTGAYYVLVQEIFPKDPKITYVSGYTEPDGSNVHEFTFSARAGSFPIEDVEWDFGDGTESLILTRNTSGGYRGKRIETEYTTAVYTGDASWNHFDKDGVDYGAWDASAGSAYAAGGPASGVYPEFDPRDWTVRHKFYRTAVEDANGHLVSAMCYAANTRSMALATSIVGLSGYPDFKTVEGNVRVVDTRLASYDDNLVVTMEGNNGTSTNLYNLEWKGESNDA